MPEIGESFSHYRILSKIGQGGMGEVFLARDTSLDRNVAIKFLPQEMRSDSVARERFLREAKSAATLDHPHICVVHEANEVEGVPFIVMEYVEGETLRKDWLEARSPSVKPSSWRRRSRKDWKKPIQDTSFTGTLNRPTSCSPGRAMSRSWTSAWRNGCWLPSRRPRKRRRLRN